MKQYSLLFLAILAVLTLNDGFQFARAQETNKTSVAIRTTTIPQQRKAFLTTTSRYSRTSTISARKTSTEKSRLNGSNKPLPIPIKSTTISTTLSESNEKAYEVLSKPVDVSTPSAVSNHTQTIQNGTFTNNGDNVMKKDETDSTQTSEIPDQPSSLSIFDRIFNFDRYTLILATAFIVGLFLIVLLLAIVTCICKSIDRKELGNGTITNPAYDEPKGSPTNLLKKPIYNNKIDFLGDDPIKDPLLTRPTSSDEQLKPLIVDSTNETIPLKPIGARSDSKPASNNMSVLSKSTTSLSSIDSRTVKSPETPACFLNNNKTALTKPDTELTSTTYNDVPSIKFTPNHVNKSRQQLLKEGQTSSASRRSLVARENGENAATGSDRRSTAFPKRGSVVHSTSSMQNISGGVGLNLELAKEGVEYLIETIRDKHNTISDSRTSLPYEPDSLYNSASDVYIKAIAEKREAMQKNAAQARMRPQLSNLSSDTTVSSSRTSTPQEKAIIKRSLGMLNNGVNVSVNPGGGSSKLAGQSRTESVNTLESEKSCY